MLLAASLADPRGAEPPLVYAGPNGGIPIGVAAGIVAIPQPFEAINGRVPVLRPDGQTAWIDRNLLVPYRSLTNPHATCRPVRLANGRYGFEQH